MPQISQREAARRDLVEHFVYLEEQAGLDLAERFLSHAQVSFEELARQPMICAPLPHAQPDLSGIRKWRVKGFDRHLIFYQPTSDGISIVRVLHAASDWWNLLGFEE
jgi:toxin ParE1/3/4